MKLTGSTHRRTTISTWQQKPNSRDSILKKIQAITRELGVLQSEIHAELADPSQDKSSTFFEDGAAVETLNLFKAELDQLRRILWFYIEEAARKPRAGTDHEQQSRKLERVTDLLHAISPAGSPAGNAAESGSFFERLNCVIETYMDKKPVAGEKKTSVPRDFKAFS
ncbi:MAG TPA: hypothetical protein VFP71_14955 [Candidatus Angelobacter sp.]|nr:hypothetical protein [Candidatus Angelobacter sp.]